MMRSHEPQSGWNLPPGCFEGDPRAPWNAPDPWEGRRCGECRKCRPCRMLAGDATDVCVEDDGDLAEVDPDGPACEAFEE